MANDCCDISSENDDIASSFFERQNQDLVMSFMMIMDYNPVYQSQELFTQESKVQLMVFLELGLATKVIVLEKIILECHARKKSVSNP
jgi:hypothetical protein